jgi:hypothetical protein
MGCMTCTNTFCLFLFLFFCLQFFLAVVFYSTYLTYYLQNLRINLEAYPDIYISMGMHFEQSNSEKDQIAMYIDSEPKCTL